MKRILLILSVLFSINISSFGQEFETCRAQFDFLFASLKKEKISHSDIEKCWEIAKELYEKRCYDYVDSVKNNMQYVSNNLTKTFANLCIKSEKNIGVEYYLKYMEYTNGSAEEQRTFSFEQLFVKFPFAVLDKIGNDKVALDWLVWGFVNNRYYGAINPYESNGVKNNRKPILTKENCEEIFYKVNPALKKEYNKYKEQVDYILKNAKLALEY